MFFGINNANFLKFFYNALLTGMPSLTYNPFNKNILHSPFNVNEYSTYINYRLTSIQLHKINEFLEKRNLDLNLAPSTLFKDNTKDYFLSINIYNCTSPVFDFLTNEPATRCELNVYVKDKDENKGTLIMDYESSILSLDPDNLFKMGGTINFVKNRDILSGLVESKNFVLDFCYNAIEPIVPYTNINSNLIKFTDRIYYTNGYYDKLYYDSSLIHNKIVECRDFNVYFKFLNLEFTEPDSIFYFENKINFVGGLWYNIFND